MSEAQIARFKQLAGIPLTESEIKLKNRLLTEGTHYESKEEQLDEVEDLNEEEKEEEEMGEEDEAADSDQEGEAGDEEVELEDEEEGEEEAPELDGLDAGDELEGDMEGGDSEALIQSLLSTVQELADKLGVSMQIDGSGGAEHAEPDEDNMGGPSDMDADNMGDEDSMADGAELDMAEEEEELNEGMEGGITAENVEIYVLSKLAPFRDLRTRFASEFSVYESQGLDEFTAVYEALLEMYLYNTNEMPGKRKEVLSQLMHEIHPFVPDEVGYEELDEGDGQIPYDSQSRRSDTRAPHGLDESAIRAISQRVAARLNESKTSLNKQKVIELVTNRVAQRLVAEAKKAKKGIKDKMKAKKEMKDEKKPVKESVSKKGDQVAGKKKAAKAGYGPGKSVYGVKGEKVANKFEMKTVKLPKTSKSNDAGILEAGKGKTKLPSSTGKGKKK